MESTETRYRSTWIMHVSTPRRISQKNPQHTGNAGNVQEPEIALEDRSIRSHPEEDLGDEHYDEDPTDERYEENPSSELLGNNRDRSTSIRVLGPKARNNEPEKTGKSRRFGLCGVLAVLVIVIVVVTLTGWIIICIIFNNCSSLVSRNTSAKLYVYISSPDNTFECYTGGNVSATFVCDGHPHCPDQSDEWNCLQLDPDKGTLRMRYNSTAYLTVCGDGWNNELANLICGELGYVGATNDSKFTNDNKFSEEKIMYRVTREDRLEFEMIDSTRCNNGLLQLQCQDYHCGRTANGDTMYQRWNNSEISVYTMCASLALAFSNNAAIKCTANIVSPRWALTSYTCIKGKTKNEGEMKWKLIAGPIEHSASKEQLTTPHIEDGLQIVDIKRVVSQFMYTDDAVLLELATPLKLNDIIGSVCLTETSSTTNPKEWCVTTGWESDLKDKSKSIQYMKNVTAVNVRTGRCDSYNEELPNNIICVESLNSNQNICYSDEGAPLMCYVNSTGQWQLEGFLSNHGNCDNRPAIYNSITPTIATWIRNTVGNGRMFEHTIINK